MRNFRSNDRGRSDEFRDRSSGDRRSGGFRGNRSGFGEGRRGGRDRGSRRSAEMYDAVCDKCKKRCQVPFRPSGDKPVLCSECFKQGGGSRQDRVSGSQSGISSEQFKQLNTKLDKILNVLESMEIVEEDESEEEGEDEEDKSEDEDSIEEDEGEEDENEEEEAETEEEPSKE